MISINYNDFKQIKYIYFFLLKKKKKDEGPLGKPMGDAAFPNAASLHASSTIWCINVTSWSCQKLAIHY